MTQLYESLYSNSYLSRSYLSGAAACAKRCEDIAWWNVGEKIMCYNDKVNARCGGGGPEKYIPVIADPIDNLPTILPNKSNPSPNTSNNFGNFGNLSSVNTRGGSTSSSLGSHKMLIIGGGIAVLLLFMMVMMM